MMTADLLPRLFHEGIKQSLHLVRYNPWTPRDDARLTSSNSNTALPDGR
jgi:hypothetical protein